MSRFVSEKDILRYLQRIKTLPHLDERQVQALTTMVNYFTEGAVTTLSNVLYEKIEGQGLGLRYGLAEHCRCFGCHEWQLVDEKGRIVEAIDDLQEWAKTVS